MTRTPEMQGPEQAEQGSSEITLEQFEKIPAGTRLKREDGTFLGIKPTQTEDGWGRNKYAFIKEMLEEREGEGDRVSEASGKTVTHVLLEYEGGNQSFYYPLRRIRT